MAEWSIAHAWKSTLSSRADAHQILPTHFPINGFRNIDVRRCLPVNDGVQPGFRGVCDTVLTQKRADGSYLTTSEVAPREANAAPDWPRLAGGIRTAPR